MGTIHAEYVPKTTYLPSTPTKDKFQNSVPTTPIKERFQNSFASASTAMTAAAATEQAPVDQASKHRRVSLSSFDSNSLSALKPIRATTSATSPTAIVTAATATATTTPVTASNQRSYSSSISGGNGLSSNRSPSSSLLTARLNSAGASAGNSSSSIDGKSSNKSSSPSLLAAKLNSAGSSSSLSGSANGSARIMQRAMTFDTLHSVAAATATAAVGATSTIAKTVKTPVQGPSSYREILHFWKTGSSGSNTSSQSAAV
ncbi:hypothetical protein EDD21DRAFT_382868 [Dissophora ornata]|nr:hypothetical protein EDD21DRAFT_382868 [Dissophora ornata]